MIDSEIRRIKKGIADMEKDMEKFYTEEIEEVVVNLKAVKVQLKELQVDHQEALRLLAQCESERRIAVAQVAHFKEVLAKK
jgi:allophanate hydrolase subunit 1